MDLWTILAALVGIAQFAYTVVRDRRQEVSA